MERGGYVYIMKKKINSTLYTGVTSNLVSRIDEHKQKHYPRSFTARYKINKLVYYECHSTIEEAIYREKQIKAGSRSKKIKLIQSMNPYWKDLFDDIVELGFY